MPLTVDFTFLAEVDHVHQKLPACEAHKAARVPALSCHFGSDHSWTPLFHLLLAIVASLSERKKKGGGGEFQSRF